MREEVATSKGEGMRWDVVMGWFVEMDCIMSWWVGC